MYIPKHFSSEETSAIISFKFHIEKIDAKFKFSQNRPEEDRIGVMNGLKHQDDLSRSVLKWMHQTGSKK